MKKIASALLLSAAITAPAFANGFTDIPVGSKYAVAEVGSISYGGLGTASAISVGGGYQVHPMVGVEVDYLMGSKLNYGFGGTFNYQLTALQFMAVGNYTINNELSVYGKAGMAMNSQKSTATVTTLCGFALCTGTVSSTATSNNLAIAIGAKYKVSRDIALRAQYQETGVSSVNVISVGAMFNF